MMGVEPDPSFIPPKVEDLLFEMQLALQIFELLPNLTNFYTGAYAGKDLTNLPLLLEWHNINDTELKLIIYSFINVIDNTHIKFFADKANQAELAAKELNSYKKQNDRPNIKSKNSGIR